MTTNSVHANSAYLTLCVFMSLDTFDHTCQCRGGCSKESSTYYHQRDLNMMSKTWGSPGYKPHTLKDKAQFFNLCNHCSGLSMRVTHIPQTRTSHTCFIVQSNRENQSLKVPANKSIDDKRVLLTCSTHLTRNCWCEMYTLKEYRTPVTCSSL